MSNFNKLKARYSKREKDLLIEHPLGFNTGSDGHMLYDFLRQLKGELEDRGYDITTLKFEVSPKLPNIEKFKTLTEKLGKPN